jgi:hypothetical protein
MTPENAPSVDLRATLARAHAPVMYWHDEDGGPAVVAIVDVEWLADLWQTAHPGEFMPHGHTEPEDRDA